MLRYVADWLAQYYSGFNVFSYLTLRAILAALTALLISLLVGPAMIRKLAEHQVGQRVRSDGPQTHLTQGRHADHGRRADPGRDRRRRRCCGPTSRNRFVWIVLARHASPSA